MNIGNLELKVYKNYIELCRVLEIQPKKAGKSRQLHWEEMGRYFRYYKKMPDGNKITIEEIYDIPKEKISKRGKSEGSRNNNNVYGQFVDRILVNYFANL